jgi:hypothetical protein
MKNLIIISSLLFFGQLNAQNQAVDSSVVKTIDGIVNYTYELLSAKEDKIKNLEKMKFLYLPTARFTLLYHATDTKPAYYESVTMDEFFEFVYDDREYYEKGFTQYELGKVVNEYNGIANVFQSFYAKDSENEEATGITSYQLIYFQERWWIADLMWTNNTNNVPIPEKYLKN